MADYQPISGFGIPPGLTMFMICAVRDPSSAVCASSMDLLNPEK